ncbi:MAG: tyrosine-type recombinase/integrase [Thermocrinis sp.]|jgi:integrase|nr:tyrosine-type recombinase/integrase [Thermocrinis sp.]
MYLIDLYLEELSKVRDPKTIEKKRYLLMHLGELRDFTKRELFEFYEELRKRLSHRSAMDVLMEVKLFYEWLRERGYSYEFSEKALEELKKKKEFDNKARKYYTEEEVEVILSAIRGTLEGTKPKPPIYYLLSVFLLCSGLRLSEALSVRREDIFKREMLSSQGEKKVFYFVRVKGKFSKEREAPMVFFKEEYRQLIEKRLVELSAGEKFFRYTLAFPKSIKVLELKKGTALNFFHDLEKELKSLGYNIPVNAHRFRYTYAVWLARKGLPINFLKEFLGHSSSKTTLEIYAQAQKEKSLEVLAQLS